MQERPSWAGRRACATAAIRRCFAELWGREGAKQFVEYSGSPPASRAAPIRCGFTRADEGEFSRELGNQFTDWRGTAESAFTLQWQAWAPTNRVGLSGGKLRSVLSYLRLLTPDTKAARPTLICGRHYALPFGQCRPIIFNTLVRRRQRKQSHQ